MIIPREIIEEIKERAQIDDVISSYGVQLTGSSTLKGLCPFHDERTPSFSVRPSFGTYRCFGCGESGDVFTFVQEKEGMSFTDAVQMLGEQYGVVVETSNNPQEEEQQRQKKRILEILQHTSELYSANFHKLHEDHPAIQELQKRNLYENPSDPNWLVRFGIGYAEEGWSHTLDYLREKGFEPDEIIQAGLAGRANNGRLYDLFRGRLTWEIRDIQGKVIGFGARKIFDHDTGPKYLNSPQTPIYDKSRVLYGLDLARKAASQEGSLILVEGYTDVMAMHAAGIHNSVATCGTAFGEQHASIAKRLLGEQGRVLFSFDGDEPGQKAARSVFQLQFPIQNSSYVVKAGNGDPCDIRLASGDEALRRMFTPNNLIPLTEFVLIHEREQHNLDIPEGRSNFLNAAAPLLAFVGDYAIREDYLKKLAYWTGHSINVVRNVMRGQPQTLRTQSTEPTPHHLPVNSTDTAFTSREKGLTALVIQYGKFLYPDFLKEIPEELFSEEILPVLLEAVLMVQAYQGNIPHLSHDDFQKPQLALELMHREFSQIENAPEELKPETTQRLFKTFLRSLQQHHESQQQETIQARFNQALDGDRDDSIALLEEVLKSRKSGLRRRR